MKVCFVIPTLTSGGAERVAVTVLNGLDAKHERVLYLFSTERAVYLDRVAPGIRVVVAKERSWLGRMRELAAFVRAFNPDVVMPFLSYFITAVAVRVAGARSVVIFNQGTPTSGFLDDADFQWRQPVRRRLFALLTRLFYARADAIVATSQGVADDLTGNYGVPATKIRILHNPVDLDVIAQKSAEPITAEIAHDSPVVAAAGRLAGVKNYPLLIGAVAELRSVTPVHAWILGEGPERAGLESMAGEHGVGALVRFLGFQPNPWSYIARADVFALTSSYEGFGNVLIEAMACGTPVIATRSVGTVEIIEDGVNGLLVESSPAAVAEAIARLLGDGDLRARLIARAREDVQHYALPRVAARYEQLFEQVAA